MDWSETLALLDDRAKNGKTAQLLIEGAEHQLEKEREENDSLTQQLTDAMEICKVQERTVQDLERQVESLKSPKRETSVDGPTIKHVYSPHTSVTSDSYYGHREGRWRLDEIESALMHLRLSGGQDDTMVRVKAGNLSSAVSDNGTVPTGWSFNPPVAPKGLRHRVWATAPVMIPLLTILAVLGWIL